MAEEGARAKAAHTEPRPRLLIEADATIPVETVANIMYTATKAGMPSMALLVDGPGRLAPLDVSPPRDWLETDRRGSRPSPSAELRAGVVTLLNGDDPPTTLELRDGDAIATWAKAVSGGEPGFTVVEVRAGVDRPLQEVVTLLDALRGRDCPAFVVDYEDPPDACLLWQTVLEPLPAIPRRPGRWSELSLSITKAEVTRGEDPRGAKALRAEVAARLDPIAACLRDSAVGQRAMPDTLSVTLGYKAGKRAAVVLGAPVDQLPDCIQEAIGMPRMGAKGLPGDGFVSITIDVPP